MPALRDLLELVCRSAETAGHRLPEPVLILIERRLREEWGAQRVYIPPPESRKDPARTEAIRAAAKRLPAGVVAERFGVSSSWVHRTVRRK
jgi:DNA-binding transcriptional regulator LsrR (DeoR family)